MFLDIVILPPADISRAVGKLTAKLARGFPLRMRVDNKKLYPHISLYHLLVPRGRVKTVVAEVSRLVAEQKRVPITFQKVRSDKVYFGVSVKNTRVLFRLHQKILLGLRKFHVGVPKAPSGASQPAQTTPYLKKFGVEYVLNFFRPHITLLGMKNKEDAEEVLKVANREKNLENFFADNVSVAAVNRYWQVYKVIKKFKLK